MSRSGTFARFRHLSALAEAIADGHCRTAFRERRRDIRADEAGAAGDENHVQTWKFVGRDFGPRPLRSCDIADFTPLLQERHMAGLGCVAP